MQPVKILKFLRQLGVLVQRNLQLIWNAKLLLDSLALLPLCPADASIVDVGTGAGLPGRPLAVALPGARVTLLVYGYDDKRNYVWGACRKA